MDKQLNMNHGFKKLRKSIQFRLDEKQIPVSETIAKTYEDNMKHQDGNNYIDVSHQMGIITSCISSRFIQTSILLRFIDWSI